MLYGVPVKVLFLDKFVRNKVTFKQCINLLPVTVLDVFLHWLYVGSKYRLEISRQYESV